MNEEKNLERKNRKTARSEYRSIRNLIIVFTLVYLIFGGLILAYYAHGSNVCDIFFGYENLGQYENRIQMYVTLITVAVSAFSVFGIVMTVIAAFNTSHLNEKMSIMQQEQDKLNEKQLSIAKMEVVVKQLEVQYDILNAKTYRWARKNNEAMEELVKAEASGIWKSRVLLEKGDIYSDQLAVLTERVQLLIDGIEGFNDDKLDEIKFIGETDVNHGDREAKTIKQDVILKYKEYYLPTQERLILLAKDCYEKALESIDKSSDVIKDEINCVTALAGINGLEWEIYGRNQVDEEGILRTSEEFYKQALKLDPKSPEIYFDLAITLLHKGEDKKAYKQFCTAIEYDKKEEISKYQFNDKEGFKALFDSKYLREYKEILEDWFNSYKMQ